MMTMDYTNLDFKSHPEVLHVYAKPRYVLGKKNGFFIQFYTLDEGDDGQLRIRSINPRTIPESVFNATFVKIGDLKTGGIFIKSPEPALAIKAGESGSILSRDVESGKVVESFIVSRKSGMVEVLDSATFTNRYTEDDPRNLPMPSIGDKKQSDISLS